MPTDLRERRGVTRWVPDSSGALSRVRLRAGRELAVINVSAGGVFVEGTTRLLPGTHVEVHVTAAQGRVLVRARVVRCAVWNVTPEVIEYRGALAFSAYIDVRPPEGTATASTVGSFIDPQAAASAHSATERTKPSQP